MKKIYAAIIFVCASATINAQSFVDNYYSCYGWGLNFGAGPGQVYSPVYSSQLYDTASFAYQNSYVGISVSYEGRYNIFQPNDNSAISLKGRPTLNIIFGQSLLGINVPLGIGLELGNGSTYKSESNTGFTFTAGYSLNFDPLVKSADIFETAQAYQVGIKTNWGSPFISAGVRYWGRKNKLEEVTILYGFGGGSNAALPSNAEYYGIISNLDDGKDFKSSYMLIISWNIYLNY